MNNQCFVIQPFDRDKFDKRYNEIYQPAILKADLTPYRVDRDPSVKVPIEQIEEGIKSSTICFADISLDNPNVWYELGFAFACNKDVVMVCSNEREKFPFDIQHKHIIRYSTGSLSDFQNLSLNVTEKLIAYVNKQSTVSKMIRNPIKESEGLKPHEVTMLVMIMENQIIDEDCVFVYNLRNDMKELVLTA